MYEEPGAEVGLGKQKGGPLCEYSLTDVTSRKVVTGETLVVMKFPDSISLGLASPTDRSVAVCVPTGTKLLVAVGGDRLAKFRREFGLEGPIEEAVFETKARSHSPYRDGVRFKNGREALIQQLPKGIEIVVAPLVIQEEQSDPATRAEELVAV